MLSGTRYAMAVDVARIESREIGVEVAWAGRDRVQGSALWLALASLVRREWHR
jgi:hypothetical protein